MAIEFGRDLCGYLETAEKREWLVTNGIGGYACGTVAGLPTRRYHGLLIAALDPPVGRTLLVSTIDETAHYNGRIYPLSTYRWCNGVVNPTGYRHIERFRLEGTTPVWSYAIADALVEKRIWMQPGANTTYVQYHLHRSTQPLTLWLKVLVNYRDHHHHTQGWGWHMQVTAVPQGIKVQAYSDALPFYLLSQEAESTTAHDWYYGFDLARERDRGLDDRDDHLHAATMMMTLTPGQSLTLVASTQSNPNLVGDVALQQRQAYERKLINIWKADHRTDVEGTPAWIQHLLLAADQFIVNRRTTKRPAGKTIIAGYPWFSDWGRDTMISLPGLTLATGRPEIARAILQTFADYVDQGMVPNRFPDAGEVPEYNTVDATLWYFEAIRAYYRATHDEALLRELFPVLADIIDWHCRGTRYGIHLDPSDGLLYAGEPGVQLTWMDAKVGDWVVTPRIGKPVEVNALWYNALRALAQFARLIGKPYQEYEAMADRTAARFSRFWNESLGYCYDVLDGPDGPDAALRPNQILAVALTDSPLTPEQQRQVVEVCGRELLTSHGLRSLASSDPRYQGHYGGPVQQRDAAYHQGTVWGWLLGPFVIAHLRVFQNPTQAREFLEPMAYHLQAHGLGSCSEIFDGDAPMTPHGCIAQAWTVAEILRAWTLIQQHTTS
ncbi:amylo-alpha-1,6-glucosidase [Trichothermofontia sichuanensis B231]|uniref:amylo-alpha-1,6-glucosidase n=1 Tax=Trichothermofontia sichuanensis TaxID=3045816 RepID=UPI0022469DA7|nr:amylo-alpha-1,6-glucosidase [Trichothermofontia sichuanensis]UZQ55569.1 amylo-alpha-1,6-glucosidase [Trichothermofontia sichuanensis B231]